MDVEELKAAIESAGCLHNARHYKDTLTVSNWVNETYPQEDPKAQMRPSVIAKIMGWPLKFGAVFIPPDQMPEHERLFWESEVKAYAALKK